MATVTGTATVAAQRHYLSAWQSTKGVTLTVDPTPTAQHMVIGAVRAPQIGVRKNSKVAVAQMRAQKPKHKGPAR